MADKIYLKGCFCHRTDILENWELHNPILESGELALVRDGKNGNVVKIGDGETSWNDLPYTELPKGEKGNDGKDAIIDQTFNPESPNAQSGIAMDEAIKQALGDVETALDELHTYAQALITGGAIE